ncbi:uncharacterized protein LOC135495007 [Lineus longissimus]|uniref:uncharacterized protein LOC135495007 n=1 Tax=Lineus longissimus TaxID=88925 RepID=UPI00315DF5BF
MSSPIVWLKEGHSLRGADVLPVILRFKNLQVDTLQAQESLASVSKKHLLHSYSKEDLNRESKGLTGHEASALLDLIDADDSVENRRHMLHCAVLQANSMAQPGQVLSATTSTVQPAEQDTTSQAEQKGTSAEQAKGVKRGATGEKTTTTGESSRVDELEKSMKKLKQEQEILRPEWITRKQIPTSWR